MSNTNKEKNKLRRKQLQMEKKIALNKAKVAKFHPEPDFSAPSLGIAKERKKIEHEKKMFEKAKKIWHSIVSVPMGGMKKNK